MRDHVNPMYAKNLIAITECMCTLHNATTKKYDVHKLKTCDWSLEKPTKNITLGIFHFIGPANSCTHTLPIINGGTTRLS